MRYQMPNPTPSASPVSSLAAKLERIHCFEDPEAAMPSSVRGVSGKLSMCYLLFAYRLDKTACTPVTWLN